MNLARKIAELIIQEEPDVRRLDLEALALVAHALAQNLGASIAAATVGCPEMHDEAVKTVMETVDGTAKSIRRRAVSMPREGHG
jgi:hypothetical protein